MASHSNEKLPPSQTLEDQGDAQSSQGKYADAILSYREASTLDPQNARIYGKLIEAHGKIEGEWGQEDFIEVMGWIMKKQELENPAIQEVHERLTPLYAQIRQRVLELLGLPSELRSPKVDQIRKFGTAAILPLLDTLLALQDLAQQRSQDPSETESPQGATLPSEDPSEY